MLIKLVCNCLLAISIIIIANLNISEALESQSSSLNVSEYNTSENEEFFNISTELNSRLLWDSDETKKDVIGLLYLIPHQVKDRAIKKNKGDGSIYLTTSFLTC